ncbi:nitroreductase family protein [Arcanobacterium hippocoleae]|uniref:nitroreductase family protein n=1 Tax=Arcanobacterium hippocoleae TaxID=149017 RepID=UPI00333FEF40
MHHAGLIWIKDPAKKAALAKIGKQAYIANAPELFISIVDTRRNAQILHERGLESAACGSPTAFREGFTDAILLTQTLAIAAESFGYGTTLLGSVLNDYGKTIELLGLPKYTFPVLGVMFGKPAEEPQLKPRIPGELRIMTDVYQEPESWSAVLTDFDQEIQTYYDTRKVNSREDAFTLQVATKLADYPWQDEFLLRSHSKDSMYLTRRAATPAALLLQETVETLLACFIRAIDSSNFIAH